MIGTLRDWALAKIKKHWLLIVILLIALGLRIYGIQFGEPFRYHPDEIKLVLQAGHFLEPAGWTVENFFRLGSYPPLYTYMLAGIYAACCGVYLLFGILPSILAVKEFYYTDTFAFHIIARYFTALLGTASIALVYYCGNRLFNRRVAIFASIVLATVFLHVRNSHFATVDIPATFMELAAFALCVKVYMEGGLKNYVVAGFLCGLAAAMKFNVGIIGVVFVVAHIFGEYNRGTLSFKRVFSKEMIVGVVSVVLGFAVGCPMLLLDPVRFLSGVFRYSELQSYGKVGLGGGFFSYFVGGMSPGFGVFSHNSTWEALGPVLTIAGFVGTIWLIISKRQQNWLAVIFPVIFYIMIGKINYKTMRQFVPMLPFFILSAGIFIDAMLVKLRGRDIWQKVIFVALILAIIIPESAKALRWSAVMSQPDPRTRAKVWVEEHVADGTHIALEKFGPPLLEYTDVNKELKLRSGIYKRSYRKYDSQIRAFFGYKNHSVKTNELQQYLIDNEIKYVIIDSFTKDSFYLKVSENRFPKLTAERQAFYDWLDKDNSREAEFLPTSRWANVFPEITIYKLTALYPDEE